MAKSDLLKEAIADAKAVKETALANAKIALEEAFAPRIQSMLSTKLAEDEMYEDEEYPEEEPMVEDDLEQMIGGDEAPLDAPGEDVAIGDDLGMDDDLGAAAEPIVTVNGVDYAPTGGGEAGADDIIDDEPLGDLEEPGGETEIDAPVDDLELESIIRELEEDLNEDEYREEEEANVYSEAVDGDEALSPSGEDGDEGAPSDEEFNIDEIIESILSEDEDGSEESESEAVEDEDESVTEELKEAYDTIHSLRHTINEVNLLNAKLLYTNKLFRNFELNENQKMKVIENFDRAGTTREVKLVFSTLAESFNVPVKKRKMVKESYASKPSGTTAPSKKTKQIINEGNELANRWKKLAGLLD